MPYFKLDKKRSRQNRKGTGDETKSKGAFLSFGLGTESGSVVFFRKKEKPSEAEKSTAENSD